MSALALPGTHAVPDESVMQDLGAQLAQWLLECSTPGVDRPLLMGLSGELGAGKSVLVRAIIHAWGYTGPVKSPTYTLVETYATSHGPVAHLDLYRLADAQELTFIGFDDLLREARLLLVEWPEQGAGVLPALDVKVRIDYATIGRVVEIDNRLANQPCSPMLY